MVFSFPVPAVAMLSFLGLLFCLADFCAIGPVIGSLLRLAPTSGYSVDIPCGCDSSVLGEVGVTIMSAVATVIVPQRV